MSLFGGRGMMNVEMFFSGILFVVGFAVSFLLPTQFRGRPILSVAIIYCKRTNGLKWLAWHLWGKDKWARYEDIIERDVFHSCGGT